MTDTIGRRVGLIVHAAYGSQKAAAESWAVHPALLSRWINNSERPPSEETIGMISDREGYNPWWIRYGVGRPRPGGLSREGDPTGPLTSILEVVGEHGDVLEVGFMPRARRGVTSGL